MTKNSNESHNAQAGVNSTKRPARRTTRDTQRQKRATEMGQRASAAAQTRTKAPLIVGAAALVVVLAVLAWSWLKPDSHLNVDSLQSPVVAATNAGSDLYPANTSHGLEEVVKFGYLPEVPLALTADGDVVLADAENGQETMGLPAPVGDMTTADFLATKVDSPSLDGFTSQPITWTDALKNFGKATVFVATVRDAALVEQMRPAVEEHSATDAVIVRSDSFDVLRVAVGAGFTALYAGAEMPASQLKDAGITMAEVPADSDWQQYSDAGLKVWASGVEDETQLGTLAAEGIFGALASNPFTIQPSVVKTD